MRRAVLLAALILVIALPASAHVGLEPAEVPPGKGVTLSFRIGHGCEGQATDAVSIQIPAGVTGVQPYPKAGWELEVERGTLPEPVTSHQQITEGVIRVTWKGGPLEDGHTDVFQLRATIHGEQGKTVYFPVVQTCGDLEHAWIEIPADGQGGHDHGELEEPAPSLVLPAGSGAADDHAGDHGDPGGSSGPDPVVIVALVLSVVALGVSLASATATRRGKS